MPVYAHARVQNKQVGEPGILMMANQDEALCMLENFQVVTTYITRWRVVFVFSVVNVLDITNEV